MGLGVDDDPLVEADDRVFTLQLVDRVGDHQRPGGVDAAGLEGQPRLRGAASHSLGGGEAPVHLVFAQAGGGADLQSDRRDVRLPCELGGLGCVVLRLEPDGVVEHGRPFRRLGLRTSTRQVRQPTLVDDDPRTAHTSNLEAPTDRHFQRDGSVHTRETAGHPSGSGV